MSDDSNSKTNDQLSQTVKNLREQFYDSLRDGEALEAVHRSQLDGPSNEYRQRFDRSQALEAQIDDIEQSRLEQMRVERAHIDKEIAAAHRVAWVSFSNLGLEYIKGRSTVQDVLDICQISDAEAADRAGLPGVPQKPPFIWSALKWMGLAGCLILGTIGMGALVMRLSPRQLLQSPVWLGLSIGLSFILIGSATLLVQPLWRMVGASQAAKPEQAGSRLLKAVVATLVPVLLVAAVDAKAIMAINAVKSSHAAASQSFGLAFLVALALSAAYILGSAAHAFYEAYAHEAGLRIDAEKASDAREQTLSRRRLVDVDQSIEALNTVNYLEKRRNELTGEIDSAYEHYESSLDRANGNVGDPPVLSEEKHRQERVKKSEATFAKLKLDAYTMIPTSLKKTTKTDPDMSEDKE